MDTLCNLSFPLHVQGMLAPPRTRGGKVAAYLIIFQSPPAYSSFPLGGKKRLYTWLPSALLRLRNMMNPGQGGGKGKRTQRKLSIKHLPSSQKVFEEGNFRKIVWFFPPPPFDHMMTKPRIDRSEEEEEEKTRLFLRETAEGGGGEFSLFLSFSFQAPEVNFIFFSLPPRQ